jgi:PAS domain S-box-containing protein
MIKIIAVDDEPAFGEILSIYMKEFGNFQITFYTSPEDAIDKIVAGEADAVITDYLMEEMDGISFIRKVKSLVPDIPFVLLTALDDKDVILNATNAGADFIQFKSEEPSRLFPDIAQKITHSVEKYRARRESEKGSRTREMLMRAQRDLMARLSESSTTNQALDATLTTVRFLAGCNSGAIHLMNRKTNKIELAISHNLPNDLIRRFTFGDLYQVIYTKKAMYFQDPTMPDNSRYCSGGQIPIMAGTDVIGVLSFILDHPKTLSLELTDTMELITGHLGNTLVRIRSEELVRQRENELSELYKVMQELVMVIDMDGTILNVNPAATRILRYSEEELIGMPIQVLYPPKIRDEIIFQFMDLTGSGGTIQNTYPLLDRQGIEVPVETRGSIGTWGDRHVLFCISREIRERLEAERNLHEYYERISAILASSTAQIYMKNNELRYLTGNEPFLSFVQCNARELMGKTDNDFFSKEVAALREKTDKKVLLENIPLYNLEEEVYGEDGNPQWFVSSKIPVHDLTGKVTGLVGTSLDITDLVQTRQELERRDRILSAVSTVAQTLVRHNEWEPIIPECLELLGQAAGVEQVILLGMNFYGRAGFEEYYCEWTMSDIRDYLLVEPDVCSRIIPSVFWYLEKNRFYLGDSKAIRNELSLPEEEPVPSFLLLLPVFSSDTLWGTLAFVTWRKEHTSPIAEIEALIMASEVIGSAISRYQTEELFHKPVERSLVGVYLVQDYRFIYTNPRLSEILGCNREDLENSPLLRYIHPEDADMVLSHHQRIIVNPDETDDYEFRGITADGRMIWIENLISGIIYKGKPAIIGSIMDITVRKQAENDIRLSLKEKDILLREVHHRVKNNMQIIVSMLRIQSSMVDNPVVSDVLQESKNRILSMAIVHEKLYRTDNLVSINLLEYINSLASTLISDFSPDESLITLDLICDPSIEMTIDAGIPLGLIMNELITNSFKHGFYPDQKGTIGITIVPKQSNLEILYRDTGRGLPPGFDMETSETLGMQIISNLIFQSSGEISFSTDNGTVVKMKIPIQEGFIIRGEEHATGE